jgi:hypothetical protein
MRTVWGLTAAVLAVAVVADIAVGADRPGFTAVLAFVGCLAIIVVSKWLGLHLLQRSEEYYGEAEDA